MRLGKEESIGLVHGNNILLVIRAKGLTLFLPLAGDEALGTSTDSPVSTDNIFDRVDTAEGREEDGQSAERQANSRPAVLDDEVLKHVVGNTDLVD